MDDRLSEKTNFKRERRELLLKQLDDATAAVVTASTCVFLVASAVTGRQFVSKHGITTDMKSLQSIGRDIRTVMIGTNIDTLRFKTETIP